jgi:hypothetical protein
MMVFYDSKWLDAIVNLDIEIEAGKQWNCIGLVDSFSERAVIGRV